MLYSIIFYLIIWSSIFHWSWKLSVWLGWLAKASGILLSHNSGLLRHSPLLFWLPLSQSMYASGPWPLLFFPKEVGNRSGTVTTYLAFAQIQTQSLCMEGTLMDWASFHPKILFRYKNHSTTFLFCRSWSSGPRKYGLKTH